MNTMDEKDEKIQAEIHAVIMILNVFGDWLPVIRRISIWVTL